MGILLAPTLVGLSVSQLNIFLNTLLASFLARGSVTYLYYAMRLVQFPLGVFGVALSTALLPTLSSQAAKGKTQALRDTLSFGLRLILFITIPAMIGLIALRTPIIHLLFEHGRFLAVDTAATARALLCYTVGLWAFAGVRVVVPVFYAQHDTKTPVITAIVAVAANIGLSLALMGPLGHSGLALATALASVLNMAILLVVLRRRLGRFGGRRIARSALQSIAAALPTVVVGGAISALEVWTEPGVWPTKGAILLVGIGASAGSYVGIQMAWRNPEARFVWELVTRRRAGAAPSEAE
jgi:putative peptidoglycan lipid II flippase